MGDLQKALRDFKSDKKFCGKGALCLALVVTQHARGGLPLAPDALLTDGGGQVLGMGRAAVQAILKRHGIERVLAAEGGRTSQGSIGRMREYVAFLNALGAAGEVDIDAVEAFWVGCVRDFFASEPETTAHKPLKINPDASLLGLRALVRGIIEQAQKRQKDNPGATYAGTVLQHLVGAKLDLILSEGDGVAHYSANAADGPTARAGDFVLDDVAIHVTTAPSEALVRKCRANIEAGLRPVVVTIAESRAGLESIAKGFDIDGRIDVIEAEQFIATNLFEWGRFQNRFTKEALVNIVNRYNEIVAEHETDPSLKIEM